MNSVSNKTMKITELFKGFAGDLCLLAFGDVSARALIGLDYSVMTGNTVQVVFTFDEAAVAPRTFTIDDRHVSRSISAIPKTSWNSATCRSVSARCRASSRRPRKTAPAWF